MATPSKEKQVFTRIPARDYRKLDALRKKKHRSVAAELRLAVEKHLKGAE